MARWDHRVIQVNDIVVCTTRRYSNKYLIRIRCRILRVYGGCEGELTKEKIESEHPTTIHPCLRNSWGKFGRPYYCSRNRSRWSMKVYEKLVLLSTSNRNLRRLSLLLGHIAVFPINDEFTKLVLRVGVECYYHKTYVSHNQWQILSSGRY